MTQVFIDKKDWLENFETNNEAHIIETLVKTGWYNEKQYTKLIDDMKNMANDMKDYKTWYVISYYLDFKEYCHELYYIDKSLVKDYTPDEK